MDHVQERIGSLFHSLRELNIKNYFESTYVLYSLIAAMFVLVFIGHFGDIHIEYIDMYLYKIDPEYLPIIPEITYQDVPSPQYEELVKEAYASGGQLTMLLDIKR